MRVGVTPEGRIGAKAGGDGWNVGVTVKPNEKPRWGFEKWFKF